MSEVGGYISLLLGVSALSVFDRLMAAARRCRRGGGGPALQGWSASLVGSGVPSVTVGQPVSVRSAEADQSKVEC